MWVYLHYYYIDRHYLSVEVRNVFSFNEISSLQIPNFSQRRLDFLKIYCVIAYLSKNSLSCSIITCKHVKIILLIYR